MSTSQVKPKANKNIGWSKVLNKKRNKKSKMQICPAALVISSKGNLSYAEILKKVNSDPDLKTLVGNVS